MYQALALLTGLVLSVVVSINGSLSQIYGAFTAAAVVHGVGALFSLPLCLIKKGLRPLWRANPWWLYMGGVVGVATVLCNVLAFGHISLTSIIALSLLGQATFSLVIDLYGLFGMPRRPFEKATLIGLVFSLAGIVIMLNGSLAHVRLAAGLSLLSGITVVLARTINARLAAEIGALRGAFINHLAGFPVTLLLALTAAGPASPPLSGAAPPIWLYSGGALGVGVVWLSNLTVPRVSAFRLTVLVFLGQVFSGILLDVFSGGGLDASFTGGIVIAIGVMLSISAERAKTPGQQ